MMLDIGYYQTIRLQALDYRYDSSHDMMMVYILMGFNLIYIYLMMTLTYVKLSFLNIEHRTVSMAGLWQYCKATGGVEQYLVTGQSLNYLICLTI